MLLLSLTLSLVLLGSSWGEWARTGPGFLPRGSGGGQAGLEGKQVDRGGKGKRIEGGKRWTGAWTRPRSRGGFRKLSEG